MSNRPEFRFFPVEVFYWWDEDDPGRLVGKYLPGMSYNCSRDPRHDRLYKKCQEWQSEGKIKVAFLSAEQSFRNIKP